MRKLIAGNWKMHKTAAEAAEMLEELARLLGGTCPEGKDVLVFAPFTALEAASRSMKSLKGGMTGAQNVYPADEGAFTGEISASMLRACGADWVMTGHSERRRLFGESSALAGKKTAFALARGLKVTLCTGETLEEREDGRLADVLKDQLREGLADLPRSPAGSALSDCLAVAYEPVWAIGTGRSAGPEDIVNAHALVREQLTEILGAEGRGVRLLYGGSVKPDNAGDILELDNVDGVLVGGASLQANSFFRIITA